jgi:hypothetical protein
VEGDVAIRVGMLKFVAAENVGLSAVAKKEGQRWGVRIATLALICDCVDELEHGCEAGATREKAAAPSNETAKHTLAICVFKDTTTNILNLAERPTKVNVSA